MVMLPLSADEKRDYRRPAFDRVFAAIDVMLQRHASKHGGLVTLAWPC